MRNWIVVALILLVSGLIGAGVTFGSAGSLNFGTEKVNLQKTADASGVTAVELKSGSADVEVVKGSTDEIKASLTGRASKKYLDDLNLDVKKEGGTVTVAANIDTGFTFGISILNVTLKVELPEREYESFMLDAGSGNADVSGLQSGDVAINHGSGDLELDRLQAKQVTVNMGSGNTRISDVTSDAVNVKAGSGDVSVERMKGGELSVDADSGNISLADVDAKLVAGIGSGDFNAELAELKQPMTIEAGSGDVTIETNRRPESASVKFSTGSGSLDNEWGEAGQADEGEYGANLVFGTGETLVRVKTGSGDLSLKQR